MDCFRDVSLSRYNLLHNYTVCHPFVLLLSFISSNAIIPKIYILLLQARVKMVLYEGLIRIVTSDPVVADNVLDFLWPHFLNYYTEVKLPKRFLCSLLSTRFCRFSRVHSFSKTNKVVLMGLLLLNCFRVQNAPSKWIHALKSRMAKCALWNLWIAYCHVSRPFFDFSKIVIVHDHVMHIGSVLVLLLRRIMRFALSSF